MNRRNQLNQRHPHASPSPVLVGSTAGSGSGSTSNALGAGGSTSGRSSPAPYAYPAQGPGAGVGLAPSPYQRPGSAASQYSESPYGGGMGSGAAGIGGSGSGYSRNAMMVEGQNDERLDGLLGKVKILKDITVGIGDEVRASNMELGGMNDAFTSTSNFLNGTYRRMTKMAKRQGGTWCWFLGFVLLCLWLFVVVWWLRR